MLSQCGKFNIDGAGFKWPVELGELIEYTEVTSEIKAFIEYCKTITQKERNKIISYIDEALSQV